MTFFNFDDKRIQRAFNRISSTDNKNNKIDSQQEMDALAQLLSGVKHQISKHDMALLKSQALNFENKNIKKEYKNITGTNGNRIIDTEAEYKIAKDFLEKHRENMSIQDISLWKNMLDMYQSENPKIVINANVKQGSILQISIGENLSNKIISVDEQKQLSDKKNISPQPFPKANEKTEEKNITIENDLDKKKENEISKDTLHSKEYKIKKGDYWYKMIEENYDVKSSAEIMEIVRILKNEYFKNNKEELMKQGYKTSRANFFLKAGDIYKLPTSVIVKGKTIKLK